MSQRFTTGIVRAPEVNLHLAACTFTVWPVRAQCRSINLVCGDAPDTATVAFPTRYVGDVMPEPGTEARLSIGNRTVFRGVVGDAPRVIDASTDEVELLLYGDKWHMLRMTVGQAGIGTQGNPAGVSGFKDVGFEVCFNRDGKPNKDPEALDFSLGTDAEYWTLQDVMAFLFAHYVDEDIYLDTALLGEAFDAVPSHVALRGRTALAAVHQVCSLAGISWGLRAEQSRSVWVPVQPGHGDERRVQLFRPQGGAAASQATALHATRLRGGRSIRDCRDLYQVNSAPVVVEAMYCNVGDDPLLASVAGFKDPEYAYRLQVDVTKYSSHHLGLSLTAGAKPKPILQELVTRVNASRSAYLTAAEIAANPMLQFAERAGKPIVWIRPRIDGETARLVTGGMRLNVEQGTLDFKQQIEVRSDSTAEDGKTDEPFSLIDYLETGLDVWLVCATRIEERESAVSDEDSEFLPRRVCEMIDKSDLVPERRYHVHMPDLANIGTDPRATVEFAGDDVETYVSVAARLQDTLTAALAAAAETEAPLEAEFPFYPELYLGDLVDVVGRDVGSSGDEVITSLTYQFSAGAPSYVVAQATNVIAGMDAGRAQQAVVEED